MPDENQKLEDQKEEKERLQKQAEKQSMSYRFLRLMFKLNMRVNIKFFFTVFDMFRVEFLMSAFANFRFLKANSAFGILSLACSIIAVGMTLFIIGISA